MKWNQFFQHKLIGQERKIVTLAALGGMLEFYDFIIYGVFSIYFAHQFFPASNALMSVIESYVIFVLGYLARPIGGIIFSHIGDEQGRKKVLIITIILMGVASLGIGILPTYETIGIAAPILLLILRLIQGLALGGELPSTYVYISESIPNKLGSAFGGVMVGVNCGLLLGMLVNQLLNAFFDSAAIESFAWRLPFIFGGVLCLLSYKIRKSLQETQAFTKIHDKPKLPIVHLLKNYLPQFLSGVAMTGIMAATVVATVIFMPTYLGSILHLEIASFTHIMTYVMIINVIAIYVAGKLANLIAPQTMFRYLAYSAIPLVALCYFCINQQFYLAAALIILGMIEGFAALLVPLLLTQLFPAKIRLTGVALCYNVGFTLLGGLAPIIITSFIKNGHSVYLTPVIYLWIIFVVALIGLAYAVRHFIKTKQDTLV